MSDIYRNKKDFGKAEFSTEIPHDDSRPGRPKPREAKSQKAQYESLGSPGVVERKDKKVKMGRKLK